MTITHQDSPQFEAVLREETNGGVRINQVRVLNWIITVGLIVAVGAVSWRIYQDERNARISMNAVQRS